MTKAVEAFLLLRPEFAEQQGVLYEFEYFTNIYKKLPSIYEIITNPTSALLPSTPAQTYAICGAIAEITDPSAFEAATQYLKRLPPECAVMVAKMQTVKSLS